MMHRILIIALFALASAQALADTVKQGIPGAHPAYIEGGRDVSAGSGPALYLGPNRAAKSNALAIRPESRRSPRADFGDLRASR